jgi:hypothetical protein
MEELCHPRSQEARQRNYPSDITGEYPKARTYISANTSLSPYHGYKLPMASCSTPACFRGLAVNYIMFPFGGNPLAPHYPPCVPTHMGSNGAPDSLKSTCVYMNWDRISETWILRLGAVRRVHLTFTSEFSMETHMLEFMPKIVGHLCWWGRSL